MTIAQFSNLGEYMNVTNRFTGRCFNKLIEWRDSLSPSPRELTRKLTRVDAEGSNSFNDNGSPTGSAGKPQHLGEARQQNHGAAVRASPWTH
jgi:hypothetical protein